MVFSSRVFLNSCVVLFIHPWRRCLGSCFIDSVLSERFNICLAVSCQELVLHSWLNTKISWSLLNINKRYQKLAHYFSHVSYGIKFNKTNQDAGQRQKEMGFETSPSFQALKSQPQPCLKQFPWLLCKNINWDMVSCTLNIDLEDCPLPLNPVFKKLTLNKLYNSFLFECGASLGQNFQNRASRCTRRH